MTDKINLKTLSQQFEKTGYFIAPVGDLPAYETIQQTVRKSINNASGTNCEDLKQLHKTINAENINDVRVATYSAINQAPTFAEYYFSVFQLYIESIVGTEIAAQAKCNLSIQLPKDQNSRLGLHTDTVSGQSEYEIVCWLPLTDAKKTNSMFIFDLDDSQKMLSLLPDYQLLGMEKLYDDWRHKCTFLEMNPGECLVFSSILMHGNVINNTNTTRISLNMRFKGLFTPYNDIPHSEKKLGSFYQPFRIMPSTKLALKYKEPDGNF